MSVHTLEDVPVSSKVAADALLGEIGHWPGVEVGERRFGSRAFRLAGRHLGHVHEVADGDCLAVVEGRRALPIRTLADLQAALERFRSSYRAAVPQAASE
jgi:Family of unknown function (DUF5519)